MSTNLSTAASDVSHPTPLYSDPNSDLGISYRALAKARLNPGHRPQTSPHVRNESSDLRPGRQDVMYKI
jgi:hypothetical protein